jgi:hypothetical protein
LAVLTGCQQLLPLSPPGTSDHGGPRDVARELAPKLDADLGLKMEARPMEQTLRDRPADRLTDRRGESSWVSKNLMITSSQDTMIDEVGPDLNYGACSKPWLMNMRVSNPTSDEHYRILLGFDVSAIKSSCQVDAAQLKLVVSDDSVSQSVPIVAFQLIQIWDEGSSSTDCQVHGSGGVSWTNCTNTQAWTSPGGTYLSTPLDTVTFSAGAKSMTFNLTSAVQTWISGAPNAGILLEEPNYLSGGDNWIAIYSREAAAAYRPQLTISYRCPPGD